MKKFFRNNGLSIVFFLLFIITLIGQIVMGLKEHNMEVTEEGGQPITVIQYFVSGHFLQATFENWESEFLQMVLFVVLSMFLYQKGSSESKDPEKEKEEVDREPNPKRKNAPWAVRQGGWIVNIYRHSLSYALGFIFVLSFLAHWYGSNKDFNEQQLLKHHPTESMLTYFGNHRFWFESFQNWQSEFLSVFAIVVLSIFLRDQHSAQSKPVDAANSETGG
ncbi:MAG TPA: DUF6766 family protein [Flavitalea sp.]|nr:DUF6766 family protein [Flavitalea sp.]